MTVAAMPRVPQVQGRICDTSMYRLGIGEVVSKSDMETIMHVLHVAVNC